MTKICHKTVRALAKAFMLECVVVVLFFRGLRVAATGIICLPGIMLTEVWRQTCATILPLPRTLRPPLHEWSETFAGPQTGRRYGCLPREKIMSTRSANPV